MHGAATGFPMWWMECCFRRNSSWRHFVWTEIHSTLFMAFLVCIVFKSSSFILRTLHIETRYSLATGRAVSNPCYRLFAPCYTRHDIQSNLYDPWHRRHDSLHVHMLFVDICFQYILVYQRLQKHEQASRNGNSKRAFLEFSAQSIALTSLLKSPVNMARIISIGSHITVWIYKVLTSTYHDIANDHSSRWL